MTIYLLSNSSYSPTSLLQILLWQNQHQSQIVKGFICNIRKSESNLNLTNKKSNHEKDFFYFSHILNLAMNISRNVQQTA